MKNDFIQSSNLIYLNSGTLTRTPKSVLEAVQRETMLQEENPTQYLISTWPRLWRVQQRVAEYFGARPEDFFFRHNVTQALNEFLLGMKFPAGSVAVTNLEYGAIVNIAQRLAERDARVFHTIDIPAERTLTPELLLQSIESQLMADTRILIVSHVMTGTGLVVPILELARWTRQRGIFLVVDGAQAPGALALDFSKLDDVDFYGGNLHKWWLGPTGTGFGWVPERHHDLLEPTHAGWTTSGLRPEFLAFSNGEMFATKMLMAYCLNWPLFFALEELVAWWLHQDKNQVHQRLLDLRRFSEEEALSHGFKILSSSDPELISPLLSIELPIQFRARGVGLLQDILKSTGVQVSTPAPRGEATVRVSAHVYNSEAEIAEGWKRLADFFR